MRYFQIFPLKLISDSVLSYATVISVIVAVRMYVSIFTQITEIIPDQKLCMISADADNLTMTKYLIHSLTVTITSPISHP